MTMELRRLLISPKTVSRCPIVLSLCLTWSTCEVQTLHITSTIQVSPVKIRLFRDWRESTKNISQLTTQMVLGSLQSSTMSSSQWILILTTARERLLQTQASHISIWKSLSWWKLFLGSISSVISLRRSWSYLWIYSLVARLYCTMPIRTWISSAVSTRSLKMRLRESVRIQLRPDKKIGRLASLRYHSYGTLMEILRCICV